MKTMKKIIATALLALAAMTAQAQKTIYIPNEWRNPWPADSLLYAEQDPEGKYTWSKTRSVESDNVIIFWDNRYKTNPKNLPKSDFYYVDIDDLLKKCEAFFDLEINQLGFVHPQQSNLSKYKVMVLMNHTDTWTCYGGGYDFAVSALWLNPATCKPVGHSVAHEVGHSFHYMCFAEHAGHRDSQTDGTGFHLPVGNGQAIWEQTAQWQANQSYPELMFDQSIGVFRHSHNYAFSHEWHRYQSYWFHYYLCQHYADMKTVAQVWNQPMNGAVDFNQALMALKGLSVSDLYRLYFDYACRCATWDFDACAPYRQPYIGDFDYRCVLIGERQYQVAFYSCPQATGFNVIPLQVPAAGTVVTTALNALAPGAILQDADPGEYLNSETGTSRVSANSQGQRRYTSGGLRVNRGFRMGYVALMTDGTRRYFALDSIYGPGTSNEPESFSFTCPDEVQRLWLVVSPALKVYRQHLWDERITNDDQWPYSFSLQGTDIDQNRAIVYAAPTLDGRPVADVTLTYDVQFPRSATAYSGAAVGISGTAAATLGTALQLQPSDIDARMQAWTSRGPDDGRIMFYAETPTATLSQSGSTANGYGHWFASSGRVSSYANGYVYSEFSPSSLTFNLGQYPGKCAEGSTYTIRQALRYRQSAQTYATAHFVFRITVGGTAATTTLRSVSYDDPTASIGSTPVASPAPHRIYDLQGRPLTQLQRGISIADGRLILKP